MNYGSIIWGSKAWHLLHAFSTKKISDDKKHNYYIFYTTFIYLLPCIVCSEHYSIITDDPSSSKKKFLGHEVLTLSDFAQKISETSNLENLIVLSTVSQEEHEEGKEHKGEGEDKTLSLETKIKKYKNIKDNLKIVNLESILKNL
jgi:hypothetical protein